ncbi:hypothetical protein TCE0_060f18629 [Talaromyces pinophilus]|uniref:Zn(2)-C6 fungal-type domain-containing protein n=1 Tax=Talaromyces pinophilus TaxID=128442 RepID=A0A6V8HNZ9_TALPI|nr:hypothetical protein TCE0_060f18629 [Talaromyces pinophilus]
MRPLSACVACRERRKKCNRGPRRSRCDFCIKKGLKCSFMQNSVTHANDREYDPLLYHVEDDVSSVASSDIVPDRDLSVELVHLYFRYIHIVFHNLFHEPSFVSAVRNGTIPKVLFFGAIALSARFSSHPSLADIEPRQRGRPYAEEAARLLDLQNTSLTTIQACMLLGAIQGVEGNPATESVYFSAAARMAMIMDLPRAPATTRIDQEINVRVATDTWSSAALCLPRAIQPCKDDPLPMDELAFARLGSNDPPQPCARDKPTSTGTDSSLSLISQMIKLNQFLWDTNRLYRMFVSGQMTHDTLEASVRDLSASLVGWLSELPSNMRNTPENISYWASQSFGHIFVNLHINYNHVGQILFYPFLHDSQELDGNSTAHVSNSHYHYAQRCAQHAANLCEIVYQARANPTSEVSYSLMCHVLVIASTVHIYILLFSPNDAQISAARYRLERNFEIIDSLRKYWPCVDASLGRLKAFHNACLKSKEDSFRLDQWMLKFILEYERPVKERDVDDGLEGDRSILSFEQLG